MADFRPTTTIYVFERTGVDANNQPYFSATPQKQGWYANHAHKTFEQYSWRREASNSVRVEGKATDFYAYDMLAFQNEDGRWIYNHITSVDFINPNVTQINYEIDWMQTCMGYIAFQECWVEREMQSNDWDGSTPSWNNLQPEGIETGMLMRTPINSAMTAASFQQFSLVLLSKYDSDGEPNYNVVSLNNYPTGLNRITFSIPQNGIMSGLNSLLKKYADKGIDVANAIVGMYVCPSEYLNASGDEKVISITPDYSNIAGVPIVNAKCFTSEFYGLELSNRRGHSSELKLEQFTETDNIQLVRVCSFGEGNGGALLYPRGYEGFSPDFGVILYNDIQSPFVSNAYASWQASNLTNIATSIVGDAYQGARTGSKIGGVLGSVVPGVGNAVGAEAGMVVGGAISVLSSASKLIDKGKDPAAVGGQVAGAVLQLQLNLYGFSINWVHPRPANVRCLDQFFSRWGYRTNRFKIPNVNTRPKWNYVKTAGAEVNGPFCYEAKVAIQNMMDAGVTFWNVMNGAIIGDYSDLASNKE